MAALGVEASKAWADEGKKPELTTGKGFVATAVALLTESPVEGVPSISSEEGLRLCWG
jgi:fructose transport system substrate-binding protein